MSKSILYILMRNDLPSMNAGKAMAQASHAANAFLHEFGKRSEVLEWTKETDQGFGTVLVLAANNEELCEAVHGARGAGFDASVVDDPTYPYRTTKEIASLISSVHDTAPRVTSGDQVTLYRSEMTCGYIFGTKENCAPFVEKFPLHP